MDIYAALGLTLGVPVVVVIAGALVPLELRLLRRLERRQARGAGFFAAVIMAGNPVVGLVSVFLALSITDKLWPTYISAALLATPLTWWAISGLGRSGKRSR